MLFLYLLPFMEHKSLCSFTLIDPFLVSDLLISEPKVKTAGLCVNICHSYFSYFVDTYPRERSN